MRKFTKKGVAVIAGATIAVATSGIAYAYWTSTGSGGGHSTAASGNGTVTLVATFDAGLLAPGTSVPVTYSGTTTGATSLSIATPTAVITSDKTFGSPSVSCATDLSLTPSTLHGGVVASGATPTSLGGATLNYADSTTVDQSACEGQVVTITLTSS